MPKIQIADPKDALTLMYQLRKDGHSVTKSYMVVEWEYKKGTPKDLIPYNTEYEIL